MAHDRIGLHNARLIRIKDAGPHAFYSDTLPVGRCVPLPVSTAPPAGPCRMPRQSITDADPRPRQRLHALGVILWPGFIAAALACAVLFAFVDPLRLGAIAVPGLGISRGLGYTLGFFMTWGITSLSSAATWYLLRPAPAQSGDDDEVPLG